MVQNSLVKYIRTQLNAGYDAGSIRSYLLKYGYTLSQIDNAMQFAYPASAVKHHFHLPRAKIALIVAVICSVLLISFAAFTFLAPGKQPVQLLNLKLGLSENSFEYGGSLRFSIDLTNTGKQGYFITLRHEVYNLADQFVRFQEETIAIEKKASSSVVMPLGDTPPGSYYLKTTAFYGDETESSTASFKVVKEKQQPAVPSSQVQEPAEAERCPLSCNDNDGCTNDYCNEQTNYLCRHDKVFPCCGNGICEDDEDYSNCLSDCAVPEGKEEDIFKGKPIWEKLDMIADIAKSDKKKAMEYCAAIEQSTFRYDCLTRTAVSSNDDNVCSSIEDDSYKDKCYKESAASSRNNEVCSKISKDSKRDQCYMDFATKGDYTVCDKLVNKYLKQSCESLKKLSEVKASA
ncbi:hypothetical protein KY366_02025 [Candidatus Woesearchaeota archaeon]|nr:hypothetical protein [Candidatus Woesearchaeota archaeon]